MLDYSSRAGRSTIFNRRGKTDSIGQDTCGDFDMTIEEVKAIIEADRDRLEDIGRHL